MIVVPAQTSNQKDTSTSTDFDAFVIYSLTNLPQDHTAVCDFTKTRPYSDDHGRGRLLLARSP